MRIIKEVAKRIKEELHDAEWYAREAIEHKTLNPEIADVYHHLAMEEMTHASLLHDKVVALAKKASADREPPAVMRELWAWQHEEIMEEEAEVKRLFDMYASRS